MAINRSRVCGPPVVPARAGWSWKVMDTISAGRSHRDVSRGGTRHLRRKATA